MHKRKTSKTISFTLPNHILKFLVANDLKGTSGSKMRNTILGAYSQRYPEFACWSEERGGEANAKRDKFIREQQYKKKYLQIIITTDIG